MSILEPSRPTPAGAEGWLRLPGLLGCLGACLRLPLPGRACLSPGLPAALPAGGSSPGGRFGRAHVIGFRLRSLSDREARRRPERRELQLPRTGPGWKVDRCLHRSADHPLETTTAVAWVRAGGRGPPPIWGQWDPDDPLGRDGVVGARGPPEGSGSRPGPRSAPDAGSRPGGQWCGFDPPLLAAGWGEGCGTAIPRGRRWCRLGGARQWDGRSPQGKVQKQKFRFFWVGIVGVDPGGRQQDAPRSPVFGLGRIVSRTVL